MYGQTKIAIVGGGTLVYTAFALNQHSDCKVPLLTACTTS